jgi:predicted  nucleic acid-binding Zn-ribbon protein
MKRAPFFICLECGHLFYSGSAAMRASIGNSGCPGCCGSDIDAWSAKTEAEVRALAVIAGNERADSAKMAYACGYAD